MLMMYSISRRVVLALSLALLLCPEITLSGEPKKAQKNAQNGNDEKPAEKWKKKDIRDYNDADMERLFQQWEENDDEPDNPDDLSPYDRPKPKIDLSKLNMKDPEAVMKMTKRGQPIMVFVSVSGNPTQEETEKISARWQDQLFNANINFKRYVVGADRLLFHVDDGSWAFDIKNFLIEQDRCESVTIDQQIYYGKGSGKTVDNKPHIVGEEIVKKKEAGKKEKKKDKKKKPQKEEL